MKNIQAVNRCDLFEKIADEVWDYVIWKHKNNQEAREDSITNDIITVIRSHFPEAWDLKVWANLGFLEDLYGSDIDVFVEVEKDRYIWYALQAKVLKMNGRYNTLRDGANNEYQWVKLRRLQKLGNCIIKYLLYNGKENYDYQALDSCDRKFKASQFGCSLVEVETIEKLALLKDDHNRFINPTFEDIHPDHASPWRVITCCPVDHTDLKKYSFLEIESSSRLIKDLVKINEETGDPIEDEELGESAESTNQALYNTMRQAKWNPQMRLVFSKPEMLQMMFPYYD